MRSYEGKNHLGSSDNPKSPDHISQWSSKISIGLSAPNKSPKLSMPPFVINTYLPHIKMLILVISRFWHYSWFLPFLLCVFPYFPSCFTRIYVRGFQRCFTNINITNVERNTCPKISAQLFIGPLLSSKFLSLGSQMLDHMRLSSLF